MAEQPERLIDATPDDVAEAFAAAARTTGIEPTVELVGVLLAQSALETGHWDFMRNYNFGNIKANDAWLAKGGDHVYFATPPPHYPAPVSERMNLAQKDQALAMSRPRTDGSGKPDMVVRSEIKPGLFDCAFWPSHVQARFRAFFTMEEGAAAYLRKFTGRYRGALAPAARGDVYGYVTALRDLGPYFTADFDRYHDSVRSLYLEYFDASKKAFGVAPPLPNTGAFRTDPADIDVRPEGWVKLKSGAKITKLPLWDKRNDLAARIGFMPVSAWLNARGWRLPTQAELEELHTLSHHVDPVTKVFKRSDTNHMMSHRWCAEHDREVWRRLEASGWDGSKAVVNFGKHWVRPLGTIFGWWKNAAPATAKIQPPSTFHSTDPTYSDYATTVFAVEDAAAAQPSPVIADPAGWLILKGFPPVQRSVPGDKGPKALALQRALIAAGYTPGRADGRHGPKTERAVQHALSDLYEPVEGDFGFGVRTLYWMHFQLVIDPREVRGPEHHPLILSYSEHCRRGGRFLGIDEFGDPAWDGGYPLRAPSDEWEWCAIAQSAATVAELRPGETPPHGLRVSVREFAEDAREAGTLRLPGRGYEPKPGDLVLSGRLGESPLNGGRGHIEAINQRRDRRAYLLGGNEGANLEHGGRWRLEWESLDKAVAFIAR